MRARGQAEWDRIAIGWWLVACAAAGLACAGNAGGVEAEAAGKPEKATSRSGPEASETTEDAVPSPDDRATVTLMPAGREPVRVDAEVVYTSASRQQGLMYRKQLAADAGMLFLFEGERQLSFWMRNTYLPLDMIFIRADMTVLGVIENAEPLTESPRLVPGRSQFVLEVNAGYSREHGIGPGTRVRFEGAEDEFAAMPGLVR